MPKVPFSTIRNILVIKLCCLGDIIFLTPSMRALRRACPQARITMLISSWVEELVQCIPFVDDYIVFDAPYEPSLPRKSYRTLLLIKELRRQSFDLVLIGHRNKSFGILAALSGGTVRVGFQDNYFLTHSIMFDPTLHEVHRYLKLLECMGIENAASETELRPHQDDRAAVRELLAKYELADAKMLIGIFLGGGENPGSSMKIKRWYPHDYVELVDKLVDELGATVALVGSQADIPLTDMIMHDVRSSTKVVDLAGKTNLRQFVSLTTHFSLFIGGDSGPTHIAAAVGTPTLSLFGPSDPRLVAPRGKLHRYLWKQVECSPCYTPMSVMDKTRFRGSEFMCWTGTHACLRQLQVDEVFSAVIDMMRESKK